MTTKPTPPLAGVTSFGEDANYIPPPSPDVREQARIENSRIGFISEKPPISASPNRKKRSPATFTAQFTIRIREEDRERFDDYAYQHRISKGEAFRRLLDLAEEQGSAVTVTDTQV